MSMFDEVIKRIKNQFEDTSVFAEQVSQIYAALNNAIIATVINSVILTAVLWPVIDKKILIIWLISLLLITALRYISLYQFKAASPSPKESIQWARRFLFGTVSSAVIWGSASIFLFSTEDLTRQVFLAFVIGGMASGAVTTLSYIKVAAYVFIIFTLAPLAIRFFISDGELNIAMGFMILLVLFVLLQYVKQWHSKSKQNISMRIENMKQQKSLEQSEHRYETLIATATDAFVLHDTNGKIFDVNNRACKSLGYSKDELLKMSVYDIDIIANKESPIDLWNNLTEGKIVQVEGVHQRKDGATFPVEISLGVVKIDNKSLVSSLARDITERKRVENMKEEFISTVSHELRTPLTSIRGSLGLLSGGAIDELSPEVKNMLAIASNNTERLLLLINDILDIQKIEADGLTMSFKNLELISLVKQSIIDNNAYAEQYDVNFIFETEVNDFHVYANKDRLMQVMANLLSNAAKFSYENSSVEISVKKEKDNKVKVSVTDHGQGIPDNFYDKIFNKFSQSDSSDTRQNGGSGLGLNITKAIVEKHAGEIGFSSEINKGATFHFILPASRFN